MAGNVAAGLPGSCTWEPSAKRTIVARAGLTMDGSSPGPPLASTEVNSMCASNVSAMDTSTCWPSPDRSRQKRAASTAEVAWEATAKSAWDTGSGRGPVPRAVVA